MKIYLDTANRQVKRARIGDQEFETEGTVLELLRRKIADPAQIDFVDFNPGPGSSFTGLRVGAGVANAINYGLGKISPREIKLPDYGGSWTPSES